MGALHREDRDVVAETVLRRLERRHPPVHKPKLVKVKAPSR